MPRPVREDYMMLQAIRHSSGAWWSETQQIPAEGGAGGHTRKTGGHRVAAGTDASHGRTRRTAVAWRRSLPRSDAAQRNAQQPLAYDVSWKSSSSSTGARLTERITAPGPFVCTALSPGETKEVGVTVIFSGGYGSGTTWTFCTWDAVRRRWSGPAVSARGNQQLTLAADMDSARRAPPFPMQVGGGKERALFGGAGNAVRAMDRLLGRQ